MDHSELFRRLIDAKTPNDILGISEIVSDKAAKMHSNFSAEDVLYSAKSVVIYGAGAFARKVLNSWRNRMPAVVALVDSNANKQGTVLHGVSVFAPSELLSSFYGATVVVAAMETFSIEYELRYLGITPLFAEHDGSVGYHPGSWIVRHPDLFNNVFEILSDELSRFVLLSMIKARMFQNFNFPMKGNWFAVECTSHPQYFPSDIIKVTEDEFFIDCGAFDGDTVVDFVSLVWRSNIKNWHAIAIEADEENARIARTNLANYGINNISVLNGVLGFDKDVEILHNCRINGNFYCGNEMNLDDFSYKLPITFIKMDIEGAELNALRLGKKLISKDKPKLAICIYHKTEDLLNIPFYLWTEYPYYSLFMRHHRSGSLWETVCYAIPS